MAIESLGYIMYSLGIAASALVAQKVGAKKVDELGRRAGQLHA